jgi:hypothetical protein
VRSRDAWIMGLLAALPVIAHAPAWWEGRLLGPGDGAALHFPMRAAVWDAYRAGTLPAWNGGAFLGTPLLAAYRPGALYPPMALLALFPPFVAFQVLVLASLSAAALLLFVYLRRLGADRVGAYFGGMAFALGPYLVGHLGDTATVVAAPLLPLLLLALEARLERTGRWRSVGLAGSVTLLLLAGSAEACWAGAALVGGRLLVALLAGTAPAAGLRAVVGVLLAGVLLAAPQLLPTLLAAVEAGRSVTGLAAAGPPPLPGATGLVLRYASHTPAPSLALAALPLAVTQTPVPVLGLATVIALGLQWGRGPLSAPSAPALLFDLTLCVLAGLSLSAQWRARRDGLGRRLRAYFLIACLASAAALSVAAAALGPLPQSVAGAVGVLALALILYFPQAASADSVRAGVWLLPLTVSFLLQPHGREAWEGAPTRSQLATGTITRETVDRVLGPLRGERSLALVREWPREPQQAQDLGYGGLGPLMGRKSLNGYDPMVSLRTRAVLGGMGVGGTLPFGFLRSDPALLEALGVRWVEIPAGELTATTRAEEAFDVRVDEGRPRLFPLPITAATEVQVVSMLSEAEAVPQGQPVAMVEARLASGRSFSFPLRAGLETAEWAHERADVRGVVAHGLAPVIESWSGPDGRFLGHRYLGALRLPGRYNLDAIRIERLPGPGRLTVSRLWLLDGPRSTTVAPASAYLSDSGHFREVPAAPSLRVFALPASPGPAWVVAGLRRLPTDAAVLAALRAPTAWGLDPRHEALAAAADTEGVVVPDGARDARAQVARAEDGRLDVLAEGPGLLVLAEAWDAGWTARLDDAPARVLRVNHGEMGVLLPAGHHRVALRYHARGFGPGLGLLGAGLVLLAAIAGRGAAPAGVDPR